jgi:hypothetical protein
MKQLIYFLILALSLVFISCSKEEKEVKNVIKNSILYPDTIYFGNNLLSYPDSSIFEELKYYEMGVVLGIDATLKLVYTNLSEDDSINALPVWGYSNATGWAINSYDEVNNNQIFHASQTGKVNLQMMFFAYKKIGTLKIDFYENSNSVTKTKYYFWQ